MKHIIKTALLVLTLFISLTSHAGSIVYEKNHTLLILDELSVRFLVGKIRRQGYTCDSVSSARYRSDELILIECNQRQYAFVIKEYGGKWLVHVDSALYQDEPKYCHLCDAAYEGDLSKVKSGSQYAFSLFQIDKYGGTPLFYAVSKGHVEVVRALLDAGAIELVVNKRGCTTKEGESIMFAAEKPVIRDMLQDALAKHKYSKKECK